MLVLLKVPLFNPVEHIVSAERIIEASCLISHPSHGVVFQKVRCLKGTMLDMKGELLITNEAIRRLHPICLVFDDYRDYPEEGKTYHLFLYKDRCYYGQENSKSIASILQFLNTPEGQKLELYERIAAKGESRTIEILARLLLKQLDENKIERTLGLTIIERIVRSGINLEASYGENRVYRDLYRLNEATITESLDIFQKRNVYMSNYRNNTSIPVK